MKAYFEKILIELFNFSDEIEITLYGFIREGRGMCPRDFRKKGKNELKLPQPRCIFDFSIVISLVT